MKNWIVLIAFLIGGLGVNAQQTREIDNLLRQGAQHRKEKKEKKQKLQNDDKYWLGQVPVADGLVTFQKTIKAPGKSKAQLCAEVEQFMNNIIEANEKELPNISQISYKNDAEGKVIGTFGEMLYFKKKAWESDFTKFYYLLTAECKDGECKLTFNNLQYRYEEQHEVQSSYLKAEDWITDEKAFNAKKTQLKKEPGKFRRFTIDRVQNLLGQAEGFLK